MAGLFSGPTKESASRASSSGNFKGAIKQYRRLIKGDAHDHELFNNLTVCLREQGDMEASFNALLAFSEKHPDPDQGAEVVVAAEDGETQITINGRLYWEGTDATT